MFQPQTTPYSPVYSSYGLDQAPGTFAISQPNVVGGGGGGGVVVDSGGPTVFRETVFSPVAYNLGGGSLNFSAAQRNLRSQPYNNKMADHDMRAQERAAEEYERNDRIEGPMVGERRSSHAITEEYAKADPVYVAKTAALPQTYSHYRPIVGDGNCGWRATGFSYYEYLLRARSAAPLEEEIARITSLDNLLTTAGGFAYWLIEDMAAETTKLLQDLADVVEASPDEAAEVLRDRFNDPSASMSIIYHLRLLASSLLASNPTKYGGFIPDGLDVLGYRKTCLETVSTEIDHLGMALVMDVLLKPIGITVEIVYLDRSEGSTANSHIFQSHEIPITPGGPMIHLLYRPSHYDILYKEAEAVPVPQVMEDMARSSNIQVNRAQTFPQHHQIQNTTSNMADFTQLDLNILLNFPGSSYISQLSNGDYASHYQAPTAQTYMHSPMSTPSPMSSNSSMYAPSCAVMQQSFPPQQRISHSHSISSPSIPVQVQHHIQQFPGPTTQLPIHTLMPAAPVNRRPSLAPAPSLTPELPSPIANTSSFRRSKYEYSAAAEQVSFQPQTTMFKNSHFNIAHFSNTHFQPEVWTPGCDDVPSTKKKSYSYDTRKRSA